MATSTSPTASESATTADGPVLNLISKRLRSLRKKFNRILQMESNLAQGKSLNKEQEDVLRSKPVVISLIEEYEKLRSPLASALQEEISRCADDSSMEDLLGLLYFGCLFDVKLQSDFASTMLTRTHERGCCLTYDYVTDDATDLLGERDLDMISALAGLITSRPLYSGISHRSALKGCLHYAKLWLSGADQPIVGGSSVTYNSLREKLKKIMDSDYYVTTPEMKAPVDVAAAVGKYNAACQVQVSGAGEDLATDDHGDDVPAYCHQQEGKQEDIHVIEVTPEQSSCPGHDLQKDEEKESVPTAGEITTPQDEQLIEESNAVELRQQNYEPNDQQYLPRRSYQNHRGGRGGRSHKAYANSNSARGRNGWGGNGGYENGRNQYYDQGYHPRNNYYNPQVRRGGRGRGSSAGLYNYQGAPSHGGTHRPSNIELGASA